MRRLHVTPEIGAALDGKDSRFSALPMAEIERIIAVYSAGHGVTVSLKGDLSNRPEMEKLSGLDEVWAICARKPRDAQLRIFGRFVEQGCFVAFAMHERRRLGFFDNYNAEAERVPDLWSQVFGTEPPMAGLKAQDYLGGFVFDVDDI